MGAPMNTPNPISLQGPHLLPHRSLPGRPQCPPEAHWFANLASAQTQRAYQGDLRDFMAFTGINQPEEFRSVTRSYILAWRADLEKQV